MSAARPSTGCAHTPPVELIIESKDRIVARWRDGISPFMYVCRIGMLAAKSIDHTTTRPITGQKLSTTPSRPSVTVDSVAVAISAGGRRGEKPADPWRRHATEDLRAGHDRRRQPGDQVGPGIAVELEQVRLQRVEPVDADAADEQRLDHQPLHRRHAQP